MVLIRGEFSTDVHKKNIQQADNGYYNSYKCLPVLAVWPLCKSVAQGREQAAVHRCGGGLGIHGASAVVHRGQIEKSLADAEDLVELGQEGIDAD
jgi:hypothetical protein